MSTSLEVIAARTPDAPQNLSLLSASPESISFTWSVPYDGGSPIQFYKIFWDQGLGSQTSDFVNLAFTEGADNTFTIDHSLTPG